MVDISNVINESILQAPKGLGTYNVNNILYLTTETPLISFESESYKIYKDARSVEKAFGTQSSTYKDAVTVFGQKPNILAGSGALLIAPMVKNGETFETLSEAINRLSADVYFGGVLTNKSMEDAEVLAASALVETMKCILLIGSHDKNVLKKETGLFAKIAAQNLNQTKMILYTASADKARTCTAAYAGRAFSVNFSAQNAALTMNLKDLAGLEPDAGIDETTYQTCADLGVDLYVSYNGLAKVVSNGAPLYFDDVYNRLWFVLTTRVALFNALAQTATKIPQTEQGMNKLKSAARTICAQAVYNGFLAPGQWNGTDTFGNQDDFYRNISDFGYYVYSLPITEQLQSDREARLAPVIQIAAKQAGAIHHSDIIISFEA